jgi:hypothetical protein
MNGLSYEDLMGLRRRMEGLYGVKKVIQRTFEEGEALLEVHFTGSSATLADLISTTDFGDLTLLISAVKRGKLELEVMSK